MYSEVDWVLVSLGTQVQLQILFEPDYLSVYLSVPHDYAPKHMTRQSKCTLAHWVQGLGFLGPTQQKVFKEREAKIVEEEKQSKFR